MPQSAVNKIGTKCGDDEIVIKIGKSPLYENYRITKEFTKAVKDDFPALVNEDREKLPNNFHAIKGNVITIKYYGTHILLGEETWKIQRKIDGKKL